MSNKRTAFVLGGGGSRGAYEIGVWQALREMDIKIDIIAGTSVGAINGAMIVQDSFDLAVALWKELRNDMVLNNSNQDTNDEPLRKLLDRYIDEDAVRNNPVDYGLATLELPSMAIRYFYKEDIPRGKLVDYILASSALFPALKVQDINKTKYVDGGFFDNLPVEMALKKGATDVIAVDLETAGIVRKEPLKKADNLIMIRCKWDLGNVLSFDCENTARIMRLGYLDALKSFNFHDGTYFCFSKGDYGRRNLVSAETAGRIFKLSPTVLYSRQIFNQKLKKAVNDYIKETQQELEEFNYMIKNLKFELDSILKLLQKINERTLTLIIADVIKNNYPSQRPLLYKPLIALFKDESKAADYLIKEGLF